MVYSIFQDFSFILKKYTFGNSNLILILSSFLNRSGQGLIKVKISNTMFGRFFFKNVTKKVPSSSLMYYNNYGVIIYLLIYFANTNMYNKKLKKYKL